MSTPNDTDIDDAPRHSSDAIGGLVFFWCALVFLATATLLSTCLRWRRRAAFLLQPEIGRRHSKTNSSSSALIGTILTQLATLTLSLAALALDRWATDEFTYRDSRGVQYVTHFRYGLLQQRTQIIAVASGREISSSTALYDCENPVDFAIAGSGGVLLAFLILTSALCILALRILLPCSVSVRESRDAPRLWGIASTQTMLLASSTLLWSVVACVGGGITPTSSFWLLLAAVGVSVLNLATTKALLESCLPPSTHVALNQVGIAPTVNKATAKRPSQQLQLDAALDAMAKQTSSGVTQPPQPANLQQAAEDVHAITIGNADATPDRLQFALSSLPIATPILASTILPPLVPVMQLYTSRMTTPARISADADTTSPDSAHLIASPLSVEGVNLGSQVFRASPT